MTKRRSLPEVQFFSSRMNTFTESFSSLCAVFVCAALVQSPLFMLFLDCVWQMINQYPAAFEFTETYLTVLSDSMWVPLFSTFLFNSPKQQTQHLMVSAQHILWCFLPGLENQQMLNMSLLPLFLLQDFAKSKAIPQGEDQAVFFPPVWKWSQQYSPKDQTLFNNPLYVGKGAACVQNGEVKSFRRTKVFSNHPRWTASIFESECLTANARLVISSLIFIYLKIQRT